MHYSRVMAFIRTALVCGGTLLCFSALRQSAYAQEECGLEDPNVARVAPWVPQKLGESQLAESSLPAVRPDRVGRFFSLGQGQGGGALFGKTVYLSAGHGWSYSSGWRTQRPNTNGIVEDLVSTETASYFLVQYLRNMGAYVVPVRESDPNPNTSIVDDADAGFAVEGSLSLSAGGTGFATLPLPLVGDVNPFASGSDRVAEAKTTASGAGVWTFDVPESGEYNVYIGYRQDDSRAPDAHYEVRHAGGSTEFRVDQRRHGNTWMLLGRFYFEAGQSPERGAVVLHDDASPGTTLSFDVARIGGGMGVLDRGGGTSGFPRFEENARYNIQFAGAPNEVYHYTEDERNDDVGARSRFTAWDHPTGEDAVYVAWHTNAPSPRRGTSTYAYSDNPPPASLAEFSGVDGSLELMAAVHGELLADLRAVWEPGWTDDGKHTAYFGEVNPSHNPETPAILVEVAFHDTLADAEALRHPQFRRYAARAMAQGIAKYFAQRDGKSVTLPSEPPERVRIQQTGDGGLRVAFAPPSLDAAAGDAPSSYRVYLSRDGYAFDNGVDVSGTEVVFDDVGSEPVYVRVTAINAGGESMPSAVVGARATHASAGQVLIVQGFDRLDDDMLELQDLSAKSLSTVQRAPIERMNHGSYLAPIARAIDAADISFDSASAAAVASGEVALGDYAVVLWAMGEEIEVLDDVTITSLVAYLDGGGLLVLSGSELVRAHSEAGKAALLDALGVAYVSDDGDTYEVSASGDWSALGSFAFDDEGYAAYDAEAPDVLMASAGGRELLSYLGGDGGAAAVWHDTPAQGVALTLAFPFEVVAGAEARAQLMAQILGDLGIEPDPLPDDPDDPDDPGTPDATGGCGCQSSSGPGALLGAFVLLALAVARRRRLLSK